MFPYSVEVVISLVVISSVEAPAIKWVKRLIEEVIFIGSLEVRLAIEVSSEEVRKVGGSVVICSTEVIIIAKSVRVMLPIISVDVTIIIVLVLCSTETVDSVWVFIVYTVVTGSVVILVVIATVVVTSIEVGAMVVIFVGSVEIVLVVYSGDMVVVGIMIVGSVEVELSAGVVVGDFAVVIVVTSGVLASVV